MFFRQDRSIIPCKLCSTMFIQRTVLFHIYLQQSNFLCIIQNYMDKPLLAISSGSIWYFIFYIWGWWNECVLVLRRSMGELLRSWVGEWWVKRQVSHPGVFRWCASHQCLSSTCMDRVSFVTVAGNVYFPLILLFIPSFLRGSFLRILLPFFFEFLYIS